MSQDATGVTLLTLHGRVSAPSVAYDSSRFALYVQPAPFGIADLTSSSLTYLHRPLDMTVGLSGTATGSWTDIAVTVGRLWRLGDAFRIGTSGYASWEQASGFGSVAGVAATIHVSADLSEAFTVAGGADDLFSIGNWRQPPTRTLRLGLGWRGPVRMSSNLIIAPGSRTSLEIAAMGEVHEAVTLRGGLHTQPFKVHADARVNFEALWPITVSTLYTHRLGFRTSFVVEVP